MVNVTMSTFPLSYWMFLVPITLIGTLTNLTLILVWSTKRYKFSRLIVMTIAASGLISMYVYHAWVHAYLWKGSAASLCIVFFSVRQYTVTLYVYLSIIQYCFVSRLHHYQTMPRLISKRRAVCGLLLVGLWVAICRTASIAFTLIAYNDEHEDELLSISTRFFLITLSFPHVLNVVFLIRLVVCVRRCHSSLVTRALRINTLSGLVYPSRNVSSLYLTPAMVWKSVRLGELKVAMTEIISRLSASSSAVSSLSSVSSHAKERQILSPDTLRHLAKNVHLELQMAKAVVILCIPPFFVYGIGFSVKSLYKVYEVDLHTIFVQLLDALQFANFSLPLFVILIMVPTFKHTVKRKLRFRPETSRRRSRNTIRPANIETTFSTPRTCATGTTQVIASTSGSVSGASDYSTSSESAGTSDEP